MPAYMHAAPDHMVGELASRLRQERKRRGWTLKDLASRLSVSMATLSAVENRQASPDVALLVELSEALGVPVATLLPDAALLLAVVRRTFRPRDAAPLNPVRSLHSFRSWTRSA